jgi:hypothetical protein
MHPERQKKGSDLASVKLPAPELSLRNAPLSYTVMPWPIIAALQRAAEHLGGDVWRWENQDQNRWITHYATSVPGLNGFGPQELVSVWGETAETINEFLATRGFPNVQLQPWSRSKGRFGIAAVQETSLAWLQAGTASAVEYGRQTFKAVHLSKGAQVRFWDVQGFRNVVAEIPVAGASGDTVLVTEHPAVRGFNLLETAKLLGESLSGATPANYDEVIFPMISLMRRPNMNWLCGIKLDDRTGRPWELAQAIQEDRLTIDLRGAKAQSAFAGGMQLCISFKPPVSILRIEQPMLCVLRRSGLPLPLAAAWLNIDSWVPV